MALNKFQETTIPVPTHSAFRPATSHLPNHMGKHWHRDKESFAEASSRQNSPGKKPSEGSAGDPRRASKISKQLRKELAEEQLNLSRELDEYIRQFNSKAHALHGDQRALIAIFVHYLHPRWKRLVEPEEYRFKSWKEAANAAKYHARKYNVLLGVKGCKTEDRLFGGKAVGLLRSGFFAPRFVSPSISESEFESGSEHDIMMDTDKNKTLAAEDDNDDKSGSHRDEEDIIMEERQQDTNEKHSKASLSTATTTTITPSNSRSTSDPTARSPPTTTNDTGTTSTGVCYQVPPEHKGNNLAFLEISINGQTVRALLAKKRWGASVMSKALVQSLDLQPKKTLAFDIVTDFGLVEDSVGGVVLELCHPKNPQQLKQKLLVQVLPSVYGGKVDLILGADFFHHCKATFNVENRAINFIGEDAPFEVDVL